MSLKELINRAQLERLPREAAADLQRLQEYTDPIGLHNLRACLHHLHSFSSSIRNARRGLQTPAALRLAALADEKAARVSAVIAELST
jgi:hypothetical protein